MNIGMNVNKELIGNLIVLLAERCKPLYHTKLLKLLYLIDEESVKRSGCPITWLDYKVWQLGPVAEDVYFSKFEGTNKFAEFISFEAVGENRIVIRPKVVFDDGEFSDYDLEIIEEVVKIYGCKNSKALVEVTHTNGSLWCRAKEKAKLHFSEENKTSDVLIDLQKLVDNDNDKKCCYKEMKENLQLKLMLLCHSK
ncbi:MAG: Panacea domain-containing protein [Odoribacter sp.]